MSRFLFNFVILMVMFFTLTTMPVNTKILDFDLSLDKFAEWEKTQTESKKDPEETEPSNTVTDATLTVDTTYLYQPEQLTMKVESQSDVAKAASEIRDKMVLTVFDKNRQVVTLTGADIPFLEDVLADKTHANLVLDITALKLPAGQYRLELNSTSAHIDQTAAKTLAVEITQFADKTYLAAKNITTRGYTSLQIYYPDESFMFLIPLSQETSNDKLLRKTANAMATPPPAGLGLLDKAPAPRIPNIKYSNGLASFYVNASDLEPYSTGSTASLFTINTIRYSIFNINYVKRFRFYVDGKSEGEFLHGLDLDTVVERESKPMGWLGVRTSAGRLLLAPIDVYPTLPTPVEDVFALLRSGIAQDGNSDALVAPIPANVSLKGSSQQGDQLTVDLSIEGELYGGDPVWTAFMFDALTTSLTSLEGTNKVLYTVNGAPMTNLNGLSLNDAQQRKAIINPLQ